MWIESYSKMRNEITNIMLLSSMIFIATILHIFWIHFHLSRFMRCRMKEIWLDCERFYGISLIDTIRKVEVDTGRDIGVYYYKWLRAWDYGIVCMLSYCYLQNKYLVHLYGSRFLQFTCDLHWINPHQGEQDTHALVLWVATIVMIQPSKLIPEFSTSSPSDSLLQSLIQPCESPKLIFIHTDVRLSIVIWRFVHQRRFD